MAPAFGTFVTTLEGHRHAVGRRRRRVPPDHGGNPRRDGTSVELGAATSPTTYEQIVQSNGPVLTQFADAYQQLIARLG